METGQDAAQSSATSPARLLVLGNSAPDPQFVADLAYALPESDEDRPVQPLLAYSLARGQADNSQVSAGPVDVELLPRFRSRRSAEAWVEERRPDLVLWYGPPGPEALMEAISSSGRAALAAGMETPAPASGRARRQRRQVLGSFQTILAEDADAAEGLLKIVSPGTRVRTAGPLVGAPDPPSCNAAEREDFASQLNARPVWLALSPAESELPAVLAAHRMALRGAHRLLLLLAPAEDADGPDLERRLAEDGWQTARRSADDDPDDTTEIFVADSREELGLWVRLAPVTFLGGSLTPGFPVADPGAAASLGSAIVIGPELDTGSRLLSLLAERDAAQKISHASELGIAVSDLLSPDKAADRAHSAWRLIAEAVRAQELLVAEMRAALRSHSG